MSTSSSGEFVRWESPFRHWVTADGRPGPSGEGGFGAAPGRYHLYVSYACPWAHRTLIFRMLNSAFDAWGRADVDLYPEAVREQIDAVNALVYEHVNNGVYRAGLAKTQHAYEAAYDRLFETLDALEERLGRQRYLVGDRLTEADWRLFTTLVRFDAVYHGHFKCNRRRLIDYPGLWGYTRELYQVPGIAETVRMDHIKLHYYGSHRGINPSGIVPKGPELDFTTPHGRDEVGPG